MKIIATIFALLGLTALAAIVFAGAWWHLFTLGASVLMFLLCLHEIKHSK